ncbi:hypothetical protein HPC49_43730, partial [Pyxidicoccus fallax]|nr:hypothetical protein [Pyxidicoccus fallax]
AEPSERRAAANTRRTAVPTRSRRLGPVWLVIALVMLLLAAVLVFTLNPGLRVAVGLEPQGAAPARGSTPDDDAARARPTASGVARPVTAETASETAAPAAGRVVPAVATGEVPAVAPASLKVAPPPVEPAPAVEAPESAPAAVAPAPAPGPSADGADVEEEDEELLAPPEASRPRVSQKNAPTVKRAAPPKKVRPTPRGASSGGQKLTQLQLEWRAMNSLYQRMKAKHSCLPLGLVCKRYGDLRNEVEAAGDVNDEDTLQKVRKMHEELEIKQLELR